MYIKMLSPDVAAIDSYNKRLGKLAKKEKDPKMKNAFENLKIDSLNDMFIPYSKWLEMLSKESVTVIQDDNIDTVGVFVTPDCNDHYHIDDLTNDYKEVKHLVDYGVCDNASQFIKRFKDMESEGEIKKDGCYILTMMPVFREAEPDDWGWRWHKWGEYIGVQNPTHEYIHDEIGIDLVYCFNVSEVKRKV